VWRKGGGRGEKKASRLLLLSLPSFTFSVATHNYLQPEQNREEKKEKGKKKKKGKRNEVRRCGSRKEEVWGGGGRKRGKERDVNSFVMSSNSFQTLLIVRLRKGKLKRGEELGREEKEFDYID